jgi:type VI secretion system protein VasG
MSVVNLEILIDKLNPASHHALESALGMVASCGQRSVELPHWLYHLMQINDADWQALLDKVLDDKDHCMLALRNAIEQFTQGHDSAPTLSQTVIDAACEAWLMASLECGLSQVTPGFLLAAILNDTMLRQELLSKVPYFKTVNQAGLRAACIESGKVLRDQQTTDGMTQQAKTIAPISSAESALESYTVDMTALAASGQMDPIIGREYEIQQMIDVLLRRRQNNPILTGEPGVGKTACVEGFAQRVANNEVPDALKGVRVHSLDITLLQAGASVKGEFEKRLKQLIDEVQSASPAIILFIDEAHLLIGAGGNQGTGDAANMLKPALARGQLRTIAATTWRYATQHRNSII